MVGSQPFGGEGLSGTGPKAGGPLYLARFGAPAPAPQGTAAAGPARNLEQRLAQAPRATGRAPMEMPGPTGEMNRLSFLPRPAVLCLGPGTAAEEAQARAVAALGGVAVTAGGAVEADTLSALEGFSAVLWWGDAETGRGYAQALARRSGPILPVITAQPDAAHVLHERHLCVDTTAAGGNAALLASAH